MECFWHCWQPRFCGKRSCVTVAAAELGALDQKLQVMLRSWLCGLVSTQAASHARNVRPDCMPNAFAPLALSDNKAMLLTSLPPSHLQGWALRPQDIQICCRDDGSKVLLGTGAHGKVGHLSRSHNACERNSTVAQTRLVYLLLLPNSATEYLDDIAGRPDAWHRLRRCTRQPAWASRMWPSSCCLSTAGTASSRLFLIRSPSTAFSAAAPGRGLISVGSTKPARKTLTLLALCQESTSTLPSLTADAVIDEHPDTLCTPATNPMHAEGMAVPEYMSSHVATAPDVPSFVCAGGVHFERCQLRPQRAAGSRQGGQPTLLSHSSCCRQCTHL